MQKAKRRTKAAPIPILTRGDSGYRKDYSWMPGDPPEKHPLYSAMGAFKDDPFWDEFVQAMDDERRKIDERYPIKDDPEEQSVRIG